MKVKFPFESDLAPKSGVAVLKNSFTRKGIDIRKYSSNLNKCKQIIVSTPEGVHYAYGEYKVDPDTVYDLVIKGTEVPSDSEYICIVDDYFVWNFSEINSHGDKLNKGQHYIKIRNDKDMEVLDLVQGLSYFYNTKFSVNALDNSTYNIYIDGEYDAIIFTELARKEAEIRDRFNFESLKVKVYGSTKETENLTRSRYQFMF